MFKGKLPNGTLVAIKTLKKSRGAVEKSSSMKWGPLEEFIMLMWFDFWAFVQIDMKELSSMNSCPMNHLRSSFLIG